MALAEQDRPRALTLPRYFHHGSYAVGLSRWLEHFDREQVLVIPSERFYAQTGAEYRRVLEFLELADYELRDYVVHNSAASSSIDPDTRQELVDRYRKPNRLLYELVGADYGWE